MLRCVPLCRVACRSLRRVPWTSLLRQVTSHVQAAPSKLQWTGEAGEAGIVAGVGGAGAADVAKVPDMKSGELRKLAQAAAAEGASPELWDALAKRCQDSAERLNYWDAVHILQAFTEANVPNRDLFLSLGEALSAKTSKMATKHVLDILAVYEAADLRPRALYVELLHGLVRLSRSMYAEEVALTLQALARYNLGNPTVIAQLMRTIQTEIKEFRFRYLCASAGALGALHACGVHPSPAEFMEILDQRARFEVDTINVQELLDNLQAFPQLEFSWKSYEDMCMEEFLQRVAQFRTAEDVDQLVDPFNTLYFLQSNGNLESNYLRALCQWCLKGVHRPNVRSERRPTSQQLVTLHDFCLEHGIEGEPALQDALAFFVESGGGLWHQRYAQPLAYHKKRRYIRSDDPLEGVELPELPAPHSLARTPRAKQLEALPGLPGLPMPEDTAGFDAADSEVAPRRRKESGPSPLLEDSEDTLVYRIRTRSRKGPRPRHQRDHLRKRDWEKQEVPGPLWYYGGWKMRPKYQPGQSLGPRYPYARVPVGPRGAAWILRR